MGSLLPVDVQITIGKHGASYWANAYGFLLHTHLLDNLGNEFMNHTM
jgi:hypothetical protein